MVRAHTMQRLGRVEAAGNADHQLLRAGGAHARGQPLHLDAVHLLAARVARARVARGVGTRLYFSLQNQFALRHRQSELDGPKHLVRVPAHRGAEGVLPHAIGQQPVEVDVREGELRRVGEAPRLGDQRCRSRRSAHARPTPGRWSIRPGRRRCTGTPRCSAPTGCRRAGGGSPPCRPPRWTPTGWRSPSRRRAPRTTRAASAPRGPRRSPHAGRGSLISERRKIRSVPKGAVLPGQPDLALPRSVGRA